MASGAVNVNSPRLRGAMIANVAANSVMVNVGVLVRIGPNVAAGFPCTLITTSSPACARLT
jgi:hypothetical protein